MHFYRVSGLAVGSDIILPGLTALPAVRSPDVTIRQAPVAAALDNPSVSGPTWQIQGKRFLLRIPGIARFLLSDGRDIAFEAEPGADPADIPIFILGTAFGILLHQREQIVLHGSAVSVNGKAVLFCGPSGAGKSTMAAALAQRGFPLVSDDVCVVSLTGVGTPMLLSDGRQLRMWTQAIDNLELAGQRGDRVRGRLEKFYVAPADAFGGPLPLGAVYALRETRPPHMAGIELPNVVDAALILRRNAYRPLLVNQMGQKEIYFRAATAIANVAGIFHLTRALDFKAIPGVVSGLERHWREIGLTEQAA